MISSFVRWRRTVSIEFAGQFRFFQHFRKAFDVPSDKGDVEIWQELEEVSDVRLVDGPVRQDFENNEVFGRQQGNIEPSELIWTRSRDGASTRRTVS